MAKEIKPIVIGKHSTNKVQEKQILTREDIVVSARKNEQALRVTYVSNRPITIIEVD